MSVDESSSGKSVADADEAFADMFLLKKAICMQLAWLSGAACVACADGSVVDGATITSSAQTGATVKVSKISSMFFMVMLLVVN